MVAETILFNVYRRELGRNSNAMCVCCTIPICNIIIISLDDFYQLRKGSHAKIFFLHSPNTYLYI